jgi:hypothetical protein
MIITHHQSLSYETARTSIRIVFDTLHYHERKSFVYIPNNFQVWYKALVVHASHDDGVLVTSLHNEKLINFDRVVSDISFPMSQSPLTRARPEVKNEAHGSITEGA